MELNPNNKYTTMQLAYYQSQGTKENQGMDK